MKKIKKFLFGLIIFWFVGFIFLFMINSGRSDPITNQTKKEKLIQEDLSAIIEYYESSKIDQYSKENFEALIKKLTVLERKNANNEQMIKRLKYLFFSHLTYAFL